MGVARASSGRRIEVLESVPGIGGLCHFDRNYRFVLMGDLGRQNLLYLFTSNADKSTPSTTVMWTLETTVATKVFLNFRSENHVTATGVQGWLQEQHWERSTARSTVSSGIPSGLYWGPVFMKAFDPGTIELMGSNCGLGSYFVFIERLENSA